MPRKSNKTNMKFVGRIKFNNWTYDEYEPKESLEFEITRIDIQTAKRDEPEHCAVAEGLKHTFGGRQLDGVTVAVAKTRLFMANGNCLSYQTPEVLRGAVKLFDKRGKWVLQPGTFELLPVQPSQSRDVMVERARKRRGEKDNHMFGERESTNGRNKPRPLTSRVINLLSTRKNRN